MKLVVTALLQLLCGFRMCRQIGADVLIDDNPTYAYDCAQHGINVLLYDWEGAYPWSKLPDG